MPEWRKSSHSGNDSDCVELAVGTNAVSLRDSKCPEAGGFSVSADSFRAFVRSLKND
ncbi:DUF397 domain-containing protein [Saccharothrix longispora]|uniref:DUF397 domain-containing protein n=1 Tax=Saccharothrix longispora TaxID=33920 RepID=UPI0028FD6968|nr:DUF397 domain-containing protein [Saccharothrix longispora]MDU0294930.1 DUF397 domain-containing protein [Saccharothrix longispora]